MKKGNKIGANDILDIINGPSEDLNVKNSTGLSVSFDLMNKSNLGSRFEGTGDSH
jgi:hypothetical protein